MALLVAVALGIFIAYTLLHYILFLLATHLRHASDIGHELNEFERRQLVEWVPKAADFLKHDDEHRTYDDVFGPYRSELDHYCTCVFPERFSLIPIWPMACCSNCKMEVGFFGWYGDLERPLGLSLLRA